MLNISENSISKHVDAGQYSSFKTIFRFRSRKIFAWWFFGLLVILLFIMFLPWTQNVGAKGKVTALHQENRPQTIHATIAGRIESWSVQEGQFVKKGDTIVHLSEIKSEYFDPKLVERQALQVKSKEASVSAYQQKVSALESQISAVEQMLKLKTEQAKNKLKQTILKVQSDSTDLQAAITDYNIALKQAERANEMYKKDVISLVELEKRQLKLQETTSKKISSENKLLASRNELLNARIEVNNLVNEYNEKLSKARSDRFATESDWYDAQGGVAKLESQYAGYSVRSGFYYIVAPQDCYIVKALKPGLGETVKEGEPIVSIVPANTDMAVEMYIRPMDLPLVKPGNKVRLIFDGWPAFAFSGWPHASSGTFGGQVFAVDRIPSIESQYRVLVQPDPNDKPWPEAIRVGSGASGFILLNDVPVWYEIWRQLNGFPPEFYNKSTIEVPKVKK